MTLRVVRNWVLWFKPQARGAVVKSARKKGTRHPGHIIDVGYPVGQPRSSAINLVNRRD